MALRVRYGADTGATLSYSVERLADGLFFDFQAGAFSATPQARTAALPETTVPGYYGATLTPTPAADWPDGDYTVVVLEGGSTADVLGAVMRDGDDATPRLVALGDTVRDVQTNTVEGCLAGGWTAGWGKVAWDLLNKYLNVWGPGNTSPTPSKSFRVDNPANPTYRM